VRVRSREVLRVVKQFLGASRLRVDPLFGALICCRMCQSKHTASRHRRRSQAWRATFLSPDELVETTWKQCHLPELEQTSGSSASAKAGRDKRLSQGPPNCQRSEPAMGEMAHPPESDDFRRPLLRILGTRSNLSHPSETRRTDKGRLRSDGPCLELLPTQQFS
jgi:hypothetical protein